MCKCYFVTISVIYKVVKTLSEIGGELIEVPYTSGISTTEIIGKIKLS